MTRNITLLLALITSLTGTGQCTTAVSGSAQVISTDGSYPPSQQFWVCGGVDVTLNGGFFLYVESNSVVTIEANIGVFWVKTGSTLNLTGGVNNQVILETGATLNDNGTNTMVTECPDLVFTYANAPTPGCDLTTAVGEMARAAVKIHPNPATDLLRVEADPNATLAMFNNQGQLVPVERMASGQLSLATLKAGLYTLRVCANGSCSNHPVAVER